MNEEFCQILETQEKLLNARFFFHDNFQIFIKTIPVKHHNHDHSFCIDYKVNNLEKCIRFEGEVCTQKSLEHPEGFWKLCPASGTELYMPIINPLNKVRIGAMFVGIFKPIPLMELGLVSPLKNFNQQQLQYLPELTPEKKKAVYSSALLIRSYIENKILSNQNTIEKSFERKEQIIYFLKDNIKKPITLGDMAAFLKVSYSRAGQVIKENFKMTFPDLMTEIRIEKAKDLLSHSEMAIKQIALECGFKEAEYFHKIFKSIQNKTPQTYREEQKKQREHREDV